jgi:NhaP-type Na+/H+ or K+/H+ antiporter
VALPLLAVRVGYRENATLYKTLVVGGLKGGLSLALALSIPRDFPGFNVIFDMTYAVVAFTVIVQGVSIERYLKLIKTRTINTKVIL